MASAATSRSSQECSGSTSRTSPLLTPGACRLPDERPPRYGGGWIARDGMGVGSFAYGWLRENIISAEVILPGGRLRTLEGDDLGLVVGAMGRTGVIVRATLKLRKTEMDMPFAISFARQKLYRGPLTRCWSEGLPLAPWYREPADGARDAIAGRVPDLRRLPCAEPLRPKASLQGCRGRTVAKS